MKLLIASVLGIFFLACSGDPDQKSEEAKSLEYQLISFSEIDTLPEAHVTFLITDLAFSGQGPVNRYFGKIKDNRIVPPIGSTMMAGSEDLMIYEQKYFSALDSALVAGGGSDTLRLISPGNVEMVFVLSKE